MTNLNVMKTEETREANGGKTVKCQICGTYVTGNTWTQYKHCLKHGFRQTMNIFTVLALCGMI